MKKIDKLKRNAINGDQQALDKLQKLAEQGNTAAQFNLGIMYYKGTGVSQSDIIAFKWFYKAAKRGDVKAQNHLGVMYAEGKGVSQNESEAFKWFLKAADKNNDAALFNFSYLKGQMSSENIG